MRIKCLERFLRVSETKLQENGISCIILRPRRKLEDSIKMDVREVGCDPGDRIDLAEGRG